MVVKPMTGLRPAAYRSHWKCELFLRNQKETKHDDYTKQLPLGEDTLTHTVLHAVLACCLYRIARP